MKKIVFITCVILCFVNVKAIALRNVVDEKTDVIDFSININNEIFNSYDYKSNDMSLCEYPIVMHKDITYIPLTYYNCILLGVELKTEDKQVFIKKADLEKPTEYLKDQLDEKKRK